MPLLFCGVFGLFWLGMHGDSRAHAPAGRALGSGVLAGLSVWTNPTGRFTPFVVAAYVLWLLWRHPGVAPVPQARSRRRRWSPRGWLDGPIGGLLLWGAAAFVVFLPLGLEFWRHPEFFTGHASEVSIFADRVTGGGSPWPLLANNVLRVLGMFSFDGDLEWAHGIPDRPVFDWFMAIPFYIGVVLWALRLLGKGRPQPDPDRDALALFLFWAAVMLAPSVLSEAAPNYSRTLPAVPAVMLAAGLGLTWIGTLPAPAPDLGPAPGRRAGGGERGRDVLRLFRSLSRPSARSTTSTTPTRPMPWRGWRGRQTPAMPSISRRSGPTTRPWLSCAAAASSRSTPPTPSCCRRRARVRSMPGPPSSRTTPKTSPIAWTCRWRSSDDKYGQPLLAVVRLAPEQAAQWPPDMAPEQVVGPGDQVTEVTADQANAPIDGVRFDDAPTLLGINVRPGARDILLFWRAEQKTFRDLTSFVHLIGPDGARLGQIDKTPGDGTYRTPYWTPGDRVIQRYRPELNDPCAGGTPVQVVTGWYEYAAGNAPRPRLDGQGDTAVAGTYNLPFYSVPAGTLQPAEVRSIPLALDGLTLNGFTVKGDAAAGSAPLP